MDIGSKDEDILWPVKDGDERPDQTPTGNLLEKEYQFPHFKDEIMAPLFCQAWDLLLYLEEHSRKPTLWNDDEVKDSTIS